MASHNRVSSLDSQSSSSRRGSPASSTVAPDVVDPEVVAQLRRDFPGLDKNLHYVRGHTIHREYEQYKAADRTAEDASRAYDNEARRLRVPPGQPEVGRWPRGPVRSWDDHYYQEDHERLASLAEHAAETAQV
ncbi:hypothetical protein CONLIGDRAFT_716896 [Coniochaeta ligniaria NRRL 30616]|uniref:Uncharacterized protein n=1 Tax=Coniochaeta ligniaria NRRL 30616 TaxID=1408157 RepID=A0A1J7IG33_9PEZI|nr:hypothetical protein CONLIGDRAFT_716896 [Coniochaeta ligniaria NRRL 30616]